MSAPKLCKDCQWYERGVTYRPHLRQCYRPDPLASMIGGQGTGKGRFCNDERRQANLCGPDARFFAPQPPTGWRRLRLWLAATLGLLVLAGCDESRNRPLIAVTDTITGCQYVIALATPGYNNAMVHLVKGTCKNEGKVSQ